jgi:hypothetical protein
MLAVEDLKNLATVKGPCLTILEPVRDPVLQVTKPATRIVAAVQEADKLLALQGLTAEDRENLLAPIRKFATNTDWVGRSGSVAVFRAPGFTQATFWPDTIEPLVTVGEAFQVLPLIAGMAAERNYWVLALSINHIHLFRGAGVTFNEVELPGDLPRSLADFTGLDKPDHDLEGRSAKGPSSGAGFGVRFGTTSIPESEAAHLHDYFRTINRALLPVFAGHPDFPLIIAAVPRELALYRTVNTYPALVEDGIHGNADALGPERLHKEALALVAAHGLRRAEASARDLDAAAGRKLLLTDCAAIAKAAGQGQVARFYFNRELRNEPSFNSIALAVLHDSGEVISCEGAIPQGGAAAILRYRSPDETAPAEPATQLARE